MNNNERIEKARLMVEKVEDSADHSGGCYSGFAAS